MRYANRAKNIKNAARINEDPKDALLRKFQQEIEELRKQLETGGGGVDDDGQDEDSEEDEATEATEGLGTRKRKKRKSGCFSAYGQSYWADHYGSLKLPPPTPTLEPR